MDQALNLDQYVQSLALQNVWLHIHFKFFTLASNQIQKPL